MPHSRASRGGVAGAGSRVLGVRTTDCEDVSVGSAEWELLRGDMVVWVVCVAVRSGRFGIMGA